MPRRKEKTRRLWLNISWKNVKGVTHRQFIKRLLKSISDGTYALPPQWRVTLQWRNTLRGKMRKGEWQREMLDSAKSSPGWDIAVSMWLRRKL